MSGIPQEIATDLGIFHEAPAKLTYKLSQADTLQAHYQWGYKYKPLRGLSATTPRESVLEQDSPYWTGKVQWQRVWSNRLFTDVRYGFHGFDWPMQPNVAVRRKPAAARHRHQHQRRRRLGRLRQQAVPPAGCC